MTVVVFPLHLRKAMVRRMANAVLSKKTPEAARKRFEWEMEGEFNILKNALGVPVEDCRREVAALRLAVEAEINRLVYAPVGKPEGGAA